MNKQKNSLLFSLAGNVLVFVLIIYLYFRSGEMLPVYIALLVFNVIIFLINLRSFFVSRKKYDGCRYESKTRKCRGGTADDRSTAHPRGL